MVLSTVVSHSELNMRQIATTSSRLDSDAGVISAIPVLFPILLHRSCRFRVRFWKMFRAMLLAGVIRTSAC